MTRYQDGLTSDGHNKIFWIGRYICVAYAGSKLNGDKIIHKLREKFTEGVLVSDVADWASKMMAGLKNKDVHMIFVGIQNGKAEIYKLIPDEKISGSIDIATVGSPAAATVVVSERVPLVTREEAKDIVFKGIKRAKMVAYTTGGEIRLAFIQNDTFIHTESAHPQDPKSSVTRYDWRKDDFSPNGYTG